MLSGTRSFSGSVNATTAPCCFATWARMMASTSLKRGSFAIAEKDFAFGARQLPICQSR